MHRFYWLVDGELAGCSRPGGRIGGGGEADLEADLAELRERGVGAVLTLTEAPLPWGPLEAHGLASLHLPVDDFQAPSPRQLTAALDFIDVQRSDGRAVVVHCAAGQGRTGTVLAAWLIRAGSDADAAIGEVRAVCPGAVEAEPQVDALRRFAAERGWVV